MLPIFSTSCLKRVHVLATLIAFFSLFIKELCCPGKLFILGLKLLGFVLRLEILFVGRKKTGYEYLLSLSRLWFLSLSECCFCPCPELAYVPAPNVAYVSLRRIGLCPCPELAYVPAPNVVYVSLFHVPNG